MSIINFELGYKYKVNIRKTTKTPYKLQQLLPKTNFSEHNTGNITI